MKKYTRKMGSLLAALAVLVAPVASQGCWLLFYEEDKPSNFDGFVKKQKENNKGRIIYEKST